MYPDKSDTPRTDAIDAARVARGTPQYHAMLDLARTLESELDEAREKIAGARIVNDIAIGSGDTLDDLLRDLDQEIKHLRNVASGWHDKATSATLYAEGLLALLNQAECPVNGCDGGRIYEGRGNDPDVRDVGACTWCAERDAAQVSS